MISSCTNPVEGADVTEGDSVSPTNSEGSVSIPKLLIKKTQYGQQPIRLWDQDAQ